MKSLDKNWFSNGRIDFEYKKYVLLDYIQGVRRYFLQNKLYPVFSELISRYKELLEYKNQMEMMNESFPKEFVGIDLEGMQMVYEPRFFNEIPELDCVGEIVEFSLKTLKPLLDEGKEMYEFFEEDLKFTTVGIEPIYNKEGYILIRKDKVITAYKYKYFLGDITLTEIDKFKSTLSNHVNKIKMTLMKKYNMPNPATFFIDIDFDIPMDETILPIIKRKFKSEINIGAFI